MLLDSIVECISSPPRWLLNARQHHDSVVVMIDENLSSIRDLCRRLDLRLEIIGDEAIISRSSTFAAFEPYL